MTSIPWIDTTVSIFNYLILIFAVSVMLSYLVLAIISASALKSYLKENRFVNYKALLTLSDAPLVSLIAPAYNEGKTIRENVHSLLSINYNNYNVIVVNDGSKDDSMSVLTEEFSLVLSEKNTIRKSLRKQCGESMFLPTLHLPNYWL